MRITTSLIEGLDLVSASNFGITLPSGTVAILLGILKDVSGARSLVRNLRGITITMVQVLDFDLFAAVGKTYS